MTPLRRLPSRARQIGRAARLVIAGLSLSAAGLVGIAVHEGYSERAYPDPVHGTKVPTIGFGSTAGVKMGDTTDPVSALQRKEREVRVFEGAIKACVTVPLYQAEYDAYVDLAYNIGPGRDGVADGFCWAKRGGPSNLVRRLNAGDYVGACNAILDWRYAGGQDCSVSRSCRGLWLRRQQLQQRCLGAEGAAQ
ncbi:lysozyme [Piscinibacter sakaiensis]|uniref:Lysozyme n=1 Tax=Piscinibacter sakaiensis TaxID=1547922 RepID=A0A0K8P5T9_PISS1|nr:lysozyme [Piscinibacter sakaiensis]GAP37884.1 lysozyme [Piscinibacter sakaiensis]